MSGEFAYRWAIGLVLAGMEADGHIGRAERTAMAARCLDAVHRTYGAGLVGTRLVSDGYAAAAAVFALMALPSGRSAPARRAAWLEAARRATLRSAARDGTAAPDTDWSAALGPPWHASSWHAP